MSRSAKFSLGALIVVLLAGLGVGLFFALKEPPPSVKVKLNDTDETVYVKEIEGKPGVYVFRLRTADGVEDISPDDFAERVYTEQASREWWLRLLNITSPAGVIWVCVGLLGQVMFTGRMLVQWIISEKQRRSIVPEAFWWLALAGATMLLVYFLWRKDIVGVLGQSTGWFIYVRNIYLIYRAKRKEKEGEEGV